MATRSPLRHALRPVIIAVAVIVLATLPALSPCMVKWNPTLAANDEYLYYSGHDETHQELEGIYLNTIGEEAGGTQLYHPPWHNSGIHDLQWLPDGSGFLWSETLSSGWGSETCGDSYYHDCNNVLKYDYLVQGVGARGATSGPSNRTGGFNFGLARGN